MKEEKLRGSSRKLKMLRLRGSEQSLRSYTPRERRCNRRLGRCGWRNVKRKGYNGKSMRIHYQLIERSLKLEQASLIKRPIEVLDVKRNKIKGY